MRDNIIERYVVIVVGRYSIIKINFFTIDVILIWN